MKFKVDNKRNKNGKVTMIILFGLLALLVSSYLDSWILNGIGQLLLGIGVLLFLLNRKRDISEMEIDQNRIILYSLKSNTGIELLVDVTKYQLYKNAIFFSTPQKTYSVYVDDKNLRKEILEQMDKLGIMKKVSNGGRLRNIFDISFLSSFFLD